MICVISSAEILLIFIVWGLSHSFFLKSIISEDREPELGVRIILTSSTGLLVKWTSNSAVWIPLIKSARIVLIPVLFFGVITIPALKSPLSLIVIVEVLLFSETL